MKKILFLLFIFQISIHIHSQILLNNGFETISDTNSSAPKFWGYKLESGIQIYLDNKIAHSGKNSLKVLVSDSNNFVALINQECLVNISTPKRIQITGWIKTKECKKGAGFLCSQKNNKGERIDYTSSRQQEILIKNTNEWTKTEMTVLLRPDTKKIEIGALLYSSGIAWFDDINIEEYNHGSDKTVPKVSAFLDTLIKDVNENSLYSDSINWNVFSNQLKTLSNGMTTYHEAQLLANYVIGELRHYGDNHSQYMVPFAVKEMGSNDIMGAGRKVKAEYLGQGIGYVSMPGFASLNDSIGVAFSTNCQEMIKTIDTKNKICAWIVDLRDDNGGSCPPMITGLGPILGEGLIIFDVSKGDTTTYFYQNGETIAKINSKIQTGWNTRVLNPYKLKNENVPVAVLIGSGCGSSGECTAASFIGRHDTRLFGQPTAGFTKGNADFTLPDSSMIFISAGIQADRNGKKYPERIFPDEQVDQPADNPADLTIERAKKWLASFGKCN